MGGLIGLLLLPVGVALIALGLLLVSRAIEQLRRAGASGSLYWASFRRYAGYRLRSLRPLVTLLVGLALVGGGLGALYLGVVGFYSGRLLAPG